MRVADPQLRSQVLNRDNSIGEIRIENRLSSCRISQGFDSIAEVWECTDHSQCAYSLGLLAYRRAAFLIANAFM
jgi:hypothetical protein